MAVIGYARVSTIDQNPQLQFDALEKSGCDVLYVDYASGSKEDRPELTKMLSSLSTGDTLVVWKLDRLGRSTSHLLSILSNLDQKRVVFRSLTEGMDTATPMGRVIYTITAAFAEFERSQIVERTKAGHLAAKAKGVKLGRKTKVTPLHLGAIEQMKHQGLTQGVIASRIGLSRQTVGRVLRGEIRQLDTVEPLDLGNSLPVFSAEKE